MNLKQYIPIAFIIALVAFGYVMGDKNQRNIQQHMLNDCQSTYKVECEIVAKPVRR